MKRSRLSTIILLAVALFFGTVACKSKVSDADLKAKIETAIATSPLVSADVKDGVVTLSGTVSTDEEKLAVENAAKASGEKGVKSVVNNIVVEGITINTVDTDLLAKVTEFTKDFPTMQTTVSDGIITVTGELEQARVQALKMGLDALNPKRVDMSGLTVK